MESNIKSEKKQISVCVMGHVDAGKSTLVGHLKWMMGQVDKST
jgi:translation elongation factor EF-1alpha